MNLQHPEVRDLASVLMAPNLLAPASPEVITDEECRLLLQAGMPELLKLDGNPAPLMEWLASKPQSRLLGRYFEALLGFWIQKFMGASHFRSGIAIHRLKQVIGELDFVFEDAGRMLTHWEVSVKFYLCTARTPEEALHATHFIGTMTKDRLDKKFKKILGHQLTLVRGAEAREQLLELGYSGEFRSRALVKGALFYPAEVDWRSYPHPPEASATHARGWWSRRLPDRAGARWVELDKRRWLSPFLAPGSFEPLTHEQMLARGLEHFQENRTALMMALVRREGECWVETERGLWVHEAWPWPVTG